MRRHPALVPFDRPPTLASPLFLILALVLGAPAGVAHAQEADEIHWTFTGPTSVTFDWRGTADRIRYGPTSAYGFAVDAVAPTPYPYSSPGPFWEARLTGLQPASLYHYSIGDGPDHTFRTPDEPEATDFIVCAGGDIGSSIGYSSIPEVMRLIAEQRADFFLGLGDLTYGNAHGQEAVDQHFNDVMVWSRDAAYMPVWGNHEYDRPTDDLRNYKGRFDLPNPQTSPGSPALGCCGEDWYWFDYGNTRFIAIPEPWTGAWDDWFPRASAIMADADTDPTIAFVVTFGHRPSYSSGNYSPGYLGLREHLDSLGARHRKYVLDLSGHDHNYQRSTPQFGVVHVVAGIGGSSLYPFEDTPAWLAARALHQGTLWLRFTPAAIVGRVLCGPPNARDDVACGFGAVIDSFVIANPSGNQAPLVELGADRSCTLAGGVFLDASVLDDGAPAPGALAFAWRLLAGSGPVTIEDPAAEDTRVAFSALGDHVLELAAHDGELVGRDTIVVHVRDDAANAPPVVSAGADQEVVLPATAALDGSVSDDGLPAPPAVTVRWSAVSGPGAVTFGDAGAVDTQAQFAAAGVYALELRADDGELAASDTIEVHVREAPAVTHAESRVAASADDAEENDTGDVSLSSSDLELMNDAGTVQRAVGMRFANLAIPAGATIVSAHVQFQVDEAGSAATELQIHAQPVDDAPEFTAATGDLTSRLAGAGPSVTWTDVPPWAAIGDAGQAQRTPDLRAIVQSIVSRSGWRPGNAIVLIVTGAGARTAEAWDGVPEAAPLLQVAFGTSSDPVNAAPVAGAGPDLSIRVHEDAVLDGTAADDGLPELASLRAWWRVVAGPGPVTFLDSLGTDARARMQVAGDYMFEITATDGLLTAHDTARVAVQPIPTSVIDLRLASGSTDVEEREDGRIELDQRDLNLMQDGGNDQRAVGLRFTSVPISRGSVIRRAYVQFFSSDDRPDPTSLVVQAHAVDDAPPFTTGRHAVSALPRTGSAVAWSVPPWGKDQGGEVARTPDLSSVLQEIVNRPGWTSGNAIALVITGVGRRRATAYEDGPARAPTLHVELENAPDVVAVELDPQADPKAGAALLAWVVPHPVRTAGRLHFVLAEPGPVRIDLFDTQGRRLQTMLDVSWLEAGRHEVPIDLGSGARRAPRPGVHYYQVIAGRRSRWGRVVILE